MKIIKIGRSSIEIDIEGYLSRIEGEAMLPKPSPELSEYVLYKNALIWLDNKDCPAVDENELFTFLEKDFLMRN